MTPRTWQFEHGGQGLDNHRAVSSMIISGTGIKLTLISLPASP